MQCLIIDNSDHAKHKEGKSQHSLPCQNCYAFTEILYNCTRTVLCCYHTTLTYLVAWLYHSQPKSAPLQTAAACRIAIIAYSFSSVHTVKIRINTYNTSFSTILNTYLATKARVEQVQRKLSLNCCQYSEQMEISSCERINTSVTLVFLCLTFY